MVDKAEAELGELDEDEEEEEEVDEVEDDSLGEIYYASVRTFQKYEDELKMASGGSTNTQKYKTLCDSYDRIYFSGKDNSNRCYEIAKYLQYIKDKNDDDTDYRCKCLNYILNTNNKFNTYPGNIHSKLFRSYKKLSSKFGKCDVTIEHIKKKEVLEKIKKLYDLNKAMNKLDYSIKSDKSKIQKNAIEFAELYRNTRNDCTTHKTDGYCSELKVFEEYCYENTKPEKYTEASEILKMLIPNDGTSSIIVSCIMVLGIPFFLYVLYKFTPFGHWANTQIQKKNKMWNNLSENKPQLNSSRHEELNIKNSKFIVRYNSAQNF
ncbi:PIR Superfamily Protein [Plasmodium ovale curtisi]|uniref:PIR Superfamily Protein n=1 Tax=Plasmodium ovale curtisi TaxID=864141 RepID=A0A1A8X7D0_PLAOA|nr:PIR Superfamily Protein [Plasmodium ovale curtisi]SBS99694.1 PIR Superfamily Protein [Plasmodium ovale curtisi]